MTKVNLIAEFNKPSSTRPILEFNITNIMRR